MAEKKALKIIGKPKVVEEKEKPVYVKVIGRIKKDTKKELYRILIDEEISFTKWLQRQARKYINEHATE